MTSTRVAVLLTLLSLFAIGIALTTWEDARAGLHDDETGQSYIEIWVDHKEFTGGCGSHEATFGNSWYIEPCGGRFDPKILDFTLPQDLSKVTKLEIYIDTWNARVPSDVRFAINDGPEHQAVAGILYSRAPSISTISLNEVQPGANDIRFWRVGSGNTYHVHDVSFRLHFDRSDPPLAGLGSLSAELLTVNDGSGAVNAAAGGTLDIDSDQLEFVIGNVSNDVDFIEIYAYYDGYDEDNVGGSTDWHSRGRHNCHQGGVPSKCTDGDPESGLHGTIDHVGTIATDGSATYTHTWDASLIAAQPGVRFKLRTVDIDVDSTGDGRINDSDNAENVRNAPGGVSGTFTLTRDQAVVSFTVPNFAAAFLQKSDPDSAIGRCRSTNTSTTYTFELPPDVQSFDEAYLIASHYNNPKVSLNSNSRFNAFDSGEDFYALSYRSLNTAWLVPGENNLTYEAVRTCPGGEFVEAPGPMIVLKRTSNPGADSTAPWAHGATPADGSVDRPVGSKLAVDLYDSNAGINLNSLQMQVNAGSGFEPVSPTVEGGPNHYSLRFDPAEDYPNNQVVTVKVDVEDNAGNAMPTYTWSFTTIPAFEPAEVISDDFNQCELNASLWSVVNAAGDVDVTMTGDGIEVRVPEGTEHNLWGGNNKNALRLIQRVANGNLDIEVKFDTGFSEITGDLRGVQMHGLVVGEGLSGNNGNFIRFDTEFTGQGIELFLRVFEAGTPIADHAARVGLGGATPPQYLRIQRQANSWQAFYSFDGLQWTSVKSFNYALNVEEVGTFVGNAGDNPEHISVIDYFFNRNAPIDPEDAGANILPVTVTGDGFGEVLRDVACGNPVTLTAVNDLGSTFDGFSGAVNTTSPEVVVSFARDDTVTANFSRNYYTIAASAVDKNGAATANGSVGVTPPALSSGYVYSETATLTADAGEGWRFMGWSGDLISESNPLSLTVTQDYTLQATFKELFDLTTAVIGSGEITNSEPQGDGDYVDGTSLTLQALPMDEWQFVGWSGSSDSTSSTLDVAMTVDRSFYAHFIKLVRDGNGDVTVTDATAAAPGRLDVTLTAQPQAGWGLAGWDLTGDGDVDETTNPLSLTLDTPRTVRAVFKRAYTLTTDGTNGSVERDPAKEIYLEGDVVKLTAVADDGYAFVRWIGDVDATSSPAELVMNGENRDKSVTAVFEEGYGINIRTIGEGDVERIPDTQPYRFGEEVELRAIPDPGWQFDGWSGDIVSTLNPYQAVMNESKSVTATFSPVLYTVTLESSPDGFDAGRITVDQSGPYVYNSRITVQAEANDGWRFVRWGGAVEGTAPTATLAVTDDMTIVAYFEVDGHLVFLPIIQAR